MLVISDTTPILSLIKADRLDLLEKTFERVVIPDAVYAELTGNPAFADEARQVKEAAFIILESVENKGSVKSFMDKNGLDEGESEAILLVKEKKADLLLIDEKKGRRVAKEMGIPIIGTAGILLDAFDEGLLSADDVRSAVRNLQDNMIRLDRSLIAAIERHIQG